MLLLRAVTSHCMVEGNTALYPSDMLKRVLDGGTGGSVGNL